MSSETILLTGATGYVGGMLLNRLLRAGKSVRCLVRDPSALSSLAIDVIPGDVLNATSLEPAMAGAGTAYYLIHSMAGGKAYQEKDLLAATNFGRAAKEAGLKRIIYLGGLGASNNLSPHLKSRQQVGEILRKSGVPTLEFRASIIIGPGSLSFEMIRSLVEKLPVMVTPRWVSSKAQPIGIDDVVEYLFQALALDLPTSEIFEIGGPDVVSYMDIMKEYSRQRDLHRVVLPVPVITPWLSSLWLKLVTPLQARVGRQLIESVRCDTTVSNASASYFFSIRPMKLRTAIKLALQNEDKACGELRWFIPPQKRLVRPPGRFIDTRQLEISVAPDEAFYPISRIGGDDGHYSWNWAWKLRGTADKLFGGSSRQVGRTNPEGMHRGDSIDCWSVEEFIPNHLLRLRSRIKLPGRAWLQFEVNGRNRTSYITQTAVFDPKGLAGRLYWYLLYPIHSLVFAGMLKGIARRAVSEHSSHSSSKDIH